MVLYYNRCLPDCQGLNAPGSRRFRRICGAFQLHGYLSRPQNPRFPQDGQQLSPVCLLRQTGFDLRRQRQVGHGERLIVQRQEALPPALRHVKGQLNIRRLPGAGMQQQ